MKAADTVRLNDRTRRPVNLTRMGFGGAPVGNLYRRISEEDAQATLQAAFDAGIRYFDTAPLYDPGRSEERFGTALKRFGHDRVRSSTKIGRLLLDCEPLLAAAGIGGTVLVQAAPTIAETEYLLSLAERHSFIKDVVGWVEFEAADAPERISSLAEHACFVGLRPRIQNIANPDWMLHPALTPAFEALQSNNLAFDALVLPGHLANLRKLLPRHPGMRTVIDHAAKPQIRRNAVKPAQPNRQKHPAQVRD